MTISYLNRTTGFYLEKQRDEDMNLQFFVVQEVPLVSDRLFQYFRSLLHYFIKYLCAWIVLNFNDE